MIRFECKKIRCVSFSQSSNCAFDLTTGARASILFQEMVVIGHGQARADLGTRFLRLSLNLNVMKSRFMQYMAC